MNDAPDTLPLTLDQLWIYPVKSCAGIRLRSVELLETGLEWDRTWMVVDADGEFVSQRELPRMALIQPRLRMGRLELRAPGMLSLHLALDAAESPRRVRIWDDAVDAYDMGDVAAQWFTDFLGADLPPGLGPLRLVRFDPQERRLSSLRWTGGVEAPNTFGDGFPLLVVSSASLDDLNERLAAQGYPPVGIERLRANLVLGGTYPHDEDRIDRIDWHAEGAPADAPAITLQLVKPCARCTIPDVDPATGVPDGRLSPLLHTYRQDKRLMGAVTFGMNAIVRRGDGHMLHEGMRGTGHWGAW
ncbi:MOSC domain-containing protein [Tepidimonas sp.]|uniref:MOSC domain-containing protein n=1 Tax=Tepidimonas sp. TaxID=2002775 RepID=UPI002FE39AE4